MHESDDHPPNAPMFNGAIPKEPKQSLVDTFTGAAKVIAKIFVTPTKEIENWMFISPQARKLMYV